jgi:hypothetical protein
MTKYHAVMIDETGCEFGVSVTAKSRDMAYDKLQEDYPESKVAQLESPADTRRRERRMQREIERAYDDPSSDEINY